jgi:hypothetical protein
MCVEILDAPALNNHLAPFQVAIMEEDRRLWLTHQNMARGRILLLWQQASHHRLEQSEQALRLLWELVPLRRPTRLLALQTTPHLSQLPELKEMNDHHHLQQLLRPLRRVVLSVRHALLLLLPRL